MSAASNRSSTKRRLSGVTRYVVVPLLLVAVGIRIGMYIERSRPAAAPAQPAHAPQRRVAAVSAREAPPSAIAGRPGCEITGSFENNIYPSLLLSFAASHPEYARCLTIALRNLPASGSFQLRIDSGLFVLPLQVGFDAPSGAATLNPELPWNFDLLRRTTQMGPQSFVATLMADGQPEAEATLVCTVHSVNEAVSRIFLNASGQWQDTSICFAAFVNEDHPWINALLQEAMSGGSVHSFTGYQSGAQGALLQAQAVWDTLAARGLSYVNVATDSSTSPFVSTQYVRFLDQSVHDQGANCVDASVLFASILRRIGLRPVLLFRPGHCFTGFYDAPDGGRLVAFETTMLGSAPFPAAAAEGSKELQSTLPFLGTPQYSIVDIALCRQHGINPIPFEPADRN
jgi:hypothetical protein